MKKRININDYTKEELQERLFKGLVESGDPSHGNIRFTRVQGMRTLNGSLYESASWIEMTISRNRTYESFGEERNTSGNELMTISMTNAQFAEMITSLNIGTGTPVTIQSITNVQIPDTYTIPKSMDLILEEVDQSVGETFDYMKKHLSTLKKTGVTPKQKKEAIEGIESLMRRFKSNEEFYQKQFVKKLEKIEVAKKSEMEGFINTVAHKLGLEQLIKKFSTKLIGNKED